MRITFRRSGGIGALPGLAVDGTVDLGSTPPRVTAESSGYERTLDPQEAERLRAAISALRAPATRSALAATGRELRDAHHYELTVEFDDGKRETLSFNAVPGGEALKAVAAAIAPLVEWLFTESERIKQHRFAR